MVVFPDIPRALLPADGRFGCGPSKVRQAQVEALSPLLMGTSHRAEPVRRVVASLTDGLRSLLSVPQDYEIVLGNGGASAFWDIACACLIHSRAALGSWGAFGAKFASEVARAPHLHAPLIDEAAFGSLTAVTPRSPEERVDAYAYPHNETSTGVISPVYRVDAPGALTLVDATSIAGAAAIDIRRVDAYYFSLQKPSEPTEACGSPSSPPRPSIARGASSPAPASGGSRSSSRSPPRSKTPVRTKPSTPRRWRPSSWPNSRSAGSTPRAGRQP